VGHAIVRDNRKAPDASVSLILDFVSNRINRKEEAMKKELYVHDLAQQSLVALRQTGLSEKAFNCYWYRGFTPLLRHFNSLGESVYSPEIAEHFVAGCKAAKQRGEMSARSFQQIRKCAAHLAEMAASGTLSTTTLPSSSFSPAGPVFEGYITDYSENRLALGFSPATVQGSKPVIRHFLRYVKGLGHSDISRFNWDDAVSYLPVLSKSYTRVGDCLSILRSFGQYAYASELTKFDLAAAFSMRAPNKKTHVIGFTHDEVKRILDAVDCDTAIGKRDYAVLLLGSRTGLRAIDVLALCFDGIDWDRQEISIVQNKTKKPLVLPVGMPVLNAIADYILNARPTSVLPHVFLRHRSPYVQLKSTSGWSIVKRHANAAGVTWEAGDCKGFHSFRRSIASWMLEAEVSIDIIKEVLGHSNRDSSKPYLSVQQAMLARCGIGLDGIETTREELR
jgi:integrase